MHTFQSVIDNLKAKASEKTRLTYVRHGMAAERTLGVSLADMKLIAKTLKGQQELAYDLYESRLMEAMYLAGMVAKGALMSPELLESWAANSDGMSMVSEYTVPWVTVEHSAGRELAVRWIGSSAEHVASAGWSTYSGLVTTKPDSDLDLNEIEALLKLIAENIDGAKNQVKSNMNGFLISVGAYVLPLSETAKSTAHAIGTVEIDVGNTACKVPDAVAYIKKMELVGKAGVKRKTIRC